MAETTKPQDLLIFQILNTSNLCWLEKRRLGLFYLNTTTTAQDKSLDIQFGLPYGNQDAHQQAIDEWAGFTKKTEELYLLRNILSRKELLGLSEDVCQTLLDQGEVLRREIFETSGVDGTK